MISIAKAENGNFFILPDNFNISKIKIYFSDTLIKLIDSIFINDEIHSILCD